MKKLTLLAVPLLLVLISLVSPVIGADHLQQGDVPLGSEPAPVVQGETPQSTIIDIPLDIVYMQDETGSMENDIAALVSLAPEIWDGIDSITTNEFKMSVVGFRDYARYPWGSSGDHVYRLIGDFTSSRGQFVNAVNQLTASGGGDIPEAHYSAISYLLTPSHPCIDSNGNGNCTDGNDTSYGNQPNFRSGATRIILLATDASAHEPADTSGYPGPSYLQVLESLTNNRTVVIGLVPGGPGAVADIDALAEATGGSVQSTGATGDQVAEAILAALGSFRPVSAELTEVEVAPITQVADGSSVTNVYVTVRDTAGEPVPGRAVLLSTNRPGVDVITQPNTLTDGYGRTTGQIVSFEPGVSRVVVSDAIDSITFAQQPLVTFTELVQPPNEALRGSIMRLHQSSVTSLNRIAQIADETAVSGERLHGKVAANTISLAADIIFDFVGFVKTAKEMAKPAFALQYSGVMMESGLGWSRITWLKAYAFTPGALFNSTFQSVIRDGKWSSLVIPSLIDGLPYYASMFLDEAVEEIQQSAVEEIVVRLVNTPGGFYEMANYTDQAVDGLNDALTSQRDDVLDGVPIMTEAEQSAYADELQQRALVPLHYDNMLWRQQFMMDNLEKASDSINTGGIQLFILKFAAKALATAMYDGAGSLLVQGYTTSMDAYLGIKKLDASGRAYALAPGILKSSIELSQRIYLNQATGLDRVMNLLPPRPVDGRILSVIHYTEGDSWGDFWKENLAYSDVTIKNDDTETATFALITEYDYEDKLFGLPFARIPMSDLQVHELAHGQTLTIRVWYKDEEQGGTPLDKSYVNFILLGVNETGTFHADYYSTNWEPVALSRSRGRQAVILSDGIQKVENPIDLYVLGGEGEPQYDAKLMLANPFTATITTTVSLPIPPGATVVTTDGNIAGGKVTWEKSIGASDVVVANLTLEFADVQPGEPLTLPPATMSFISPGNSDFLETTSNVAEFNGAWPIDVQGVMPQVNAGVAASMPVTVTNLTGAFQAAKVMLRISDGIGMVHEAHQNISLSGNEQTTLAFDIPTGLAPEWHTAELWAEIGGVSRQYEAEAFLVAEGGIRSLFLPILLNGHTTPSQPLLNGDFEQGPGVGWQEFSSNGWAIVTHIDELPSTLPAPSGQWVAWLGGDHNEISYVEQAVTVPVDRPYLTYSRFLASEDYCGYDLAGLIVDGNVMDVYNLCTPDNSTVWSRRSVDLSAYRGQTVMLQLRVETDGSLYSSLYVDDVGFSASAAAAQAQPPAAPQAPSGGLGKRDWGAPQGSLGPATPRRLR